MPAGSAAKRKREAVDDGAGRSLDRRSGYKRTSGSSPSRNDYDSPTSQAAMNNLANELQNANASIDFNLGQHHGGGSDGAGNNSGMNGDNSQASSTAAAALAGLYPQGGSHGGEMGFGGLGSDDKNLDPQLSMVESEGTNPNDPPYIDKPAQQSGSARDTAPKPQVGSEEWHRLRKDNHKEVERRRRETINEGINELSKIVPGCEKNKGSILQRAVQYITQLQENETQNIDKWTLEKLLTEQAIAELGSTVDKLKKELDKAYREIAAWKKACEGAGISLPRDALSNGESS